MSSPYTNKLAFEKSPYLLLYAHTPVNWYPWGEEAFQLALSHDKPIFLSIGCSHSHWCQIMLQESYSNPNVAALLNECFVNVKVDKEELPHVAALYFDLAQMLSPTMEKQETPIWPLNVFLTPDLLPFFSVSCANFTLEGRGGAAFSKMLEKLRAMWENPEERGALVAQATKVLEIASFIEGACRKEPLSEDTFQATIRAIYQDIDPHYGGIRDFPKVPPSLLLRFLLREGYASQDSRALFFVLRTLHMMWLGGIYDHVGGGFYRCSIDDRWQIPCFEKRLVDNALLIRAYLEAWAYTKRPFDVVVHETISYILNALYDAKTGLFYLSEHGENWRGEEGRNYYTWTENEVKEALGDRAEMFCEYYGIREGIYGRAIPHISWELDTEAFAEHHSCSPQECEARLSEMRKLLFAKRGSRVPPFKDDQSLTFHNGIMIETLVQAGRLLGENQWIDIAERCCSFLKDRLYLNGRLLHRWRDGESKYSAGLEDYAALVLGAIALYEVGRGVVWLEFAHALMQEVLISFHSEAGGFYTTDGKDHSLLIKQSQIQDEETVSGSALLCSALIKLHIITERGHYLRSAEEILQIAQVKWHTRKFTCIGSLLAAQEYFFQQHRKILVSLGDQQDRDRILAILRGKFLPYTTLVWLSNTEGERLRCLLPEVEHSLLPKGAESKIYLLEPKQCRVFTSVQAFSDYFSQENL